MEISRRDFYSGLAATGIGLQQDVYLKDGQNDLLPEPLWTSTPAK